MECSRGEYVLTDDKRRMQFTVIMSMLETTYWARNRSPEVMDRAMQHSVCFGLLHRGRQVGFARAVTDQSTFTWICDVIIDPVHRGQGLGKWMMECLLSHPDLQTISHHLRTEDAHQLYERFGFKRVEAMRRCTQEAGS
jgi:GNAT superfamily N-acetyltransferase